MVGVELLASSGAEIWSECLSVFGPPMYLREKCPMLPSESESESGLAILWVVSMVSFILDTLHLSSFIRGTICLWCTILPFSSERFFSWTTASISHVAGRENGNIHSATMVPMALKGFGSEPAFSIDS